MKKNYYKLSWMDDEGQWQEEWLFTPQEGFDEALAFLKGKINVKKVTIEVCDKKGDPLR